MTATKPNSVESDNSTSSTTTDGQGEALDLEPDELAVLRYLRRTNTCTRKKLIHNSGLPAFRVDSILSLLETRGLVTVKRGFSMTTLQTVDRGEHDG